MNRDCSSKSELQAPCNFDSSSHSIQQKAPSPNAKNCIAPEKVHTNRPSSTSASGTCWPLTSCATKRCTSFAVSTRRFGRSCLELRSLSATMMSLPYPTITSTTSTMGKARGKKDNSIILDTKLHKYIQVPESVVHLQGMGLSAWIAKTPSQTFAVHPATCLMIDVTLMNSVECASCLSTHELFLFQKSEIIVTISKPSPQKLPLQRPPLRISFK